MCSSCQSVVMAWRTLSWYWSRGVDTHKISLYTVVQIIDLRLWKQYTVHSVNLTSLGSFLSEVCYISNCKIIKTVFFYELLKSMLGSGFDIHHNEIGKSRHVIHVQLSQVEYYSEFLVKVVSLSIKAVRYGM